MAESWEPCDYTVHYTAAVRGEAISPFSGERIVAYGDTAAMCRQRLRLRVYGEADAQGMDIRHRDEPQERPGA